METKYITRLLEDNTAKTEQILRKVNEIVASLLTVSNAVSRIEQSIPTDDEEAE